MRIIALILSLGWLLAYPGFAETVSELQTAASGHYSHPWAEAEQSAQVMTDYNIVEWEGKTYALTRTAPRGPATFAVWERQGEVWRWLFDYYELQELEGTSLAWDARIDFLYKSLHRLDPGLRKALENRNHHKRFPNLFLKETN